MKSRMLAVLLGFCAFGCGNDDSDDRGPAPIIWYGDGYPPQPPPGGYPIGGYPNDGSSGATAGGPSAGGFESGGATGLAGSPSAGGSPPLGAGATSGGSTPLAGSPSAGGASGYVGLGIGGAGTAGAPPTADCLASVSTCYDLATVFCSESTDPMVCLDLFDGCDRLAQACLSR